MSLISTVGSLIGGGEDKSTAKVMMYDIDDDGSPDVGSSRAFQYFPETVTDSRGVEWQSKTVVGGSHPIYQWTHGSPRTISFDAVFTRDLQPERTPSNAISALGSIAATISNVAKNPVGAVIGALKNGFDESTNPNIDQAVAWLRSKTYPTYDNNIASAPTKLLLVFPNSGITSYVKGIAIDSLPVIMTECNVTYESFFRNGVPRIVTVSLQFAEIVQLGNSGWGFVDGSQFDDDPDGWNGKSGYNYKNDKFQYSLRTPSTGSGKGSSLLSGAGIPKLFGG